jgi:hypothetical protein
MLSIKVYLLCEWGGVISCVRNFIEEWALKYIYSVNEGVSYLVLETSQKKCVFIFPTDVGILAVCWKPNFLMMMIMYPHYHNRSIQSKCNTVCLCFRANAVFVSALYLIHQTNMIMVTVKSKCEWWELQSGSGTRLYIVHWYFIELNVQIHVCVILNKEMFSKV